MYNLLGWNIMRHDSIDGEIDGRIYLEQTLTFNHTLKFDCIWSSRFDIFIVQYADVWKQNKICRRTRDVKNKQMNINKDHYVTDRYIIHLSTMKNI